MACWGVGPNAGLTHLVIVRPVPQSMGLFIGLSHDMTADFSQVDSVDSEKDGVPITSAIFYLLEANPEVQLILKRRGLHRCGNFNRQELLGAVLGASYPRPLVLKDFHSSYMKYTLSLSHYSINSESKISKLGPAVHEDSGV